MSVVAWRTTHCCDARVRRTDRGLDAGHHTKPELEKRHGIEQFRIGHLLLAGSSGLSHGGVATLLLAPRSGRETRAQLGDFYENARGRIVPRPPGVQEASHAAGHTLAG